MAAAQVIPSSDREGETTLSRKGRFLECVPTIGLLPASR